MSSKAIDEGKICICALATTVGAAPAASGPTLKVGVASLSTLLFATGGTPSLVVVSSTSIGPNMSCKAESDDCI